MSFWVRWKRLAQTLVRQVRLVNSFVRKSQPLGAAQQLVPARDPIELEIFKNIFHSIAEEMGAAMRRTAFSPNIKERRDYSCAIFDSAGEVVAMGDHMPVHLGSMPMSVRAAIDDLTLRPGDVAVLNDPYRGGTHLPDITMVAPVFAQARTKDARKKKNARRISTLLRARTMPMSAEPFPGPWACARRSIRKASAFRPSS
jgi:hypothetical protein